MPAILLLALYVALLIAPIGMAWAQGLPPRHWQDEIASGLALAAFAGLMAEFVLSGRFHLVSCRIGIDTTMRVHQLMARVLTGIIALHPFLYATPVSNYPDPSDTTSRLTLGLTGASLVTGLVAWLALLVMVLLAAFPRPRGTSYESWRLSHGFAALLVAVFGTLHALQAGRYSADPALARLWLALLAVAILTHVWVYAVKPAWQLAHPYVVRSVRRVARNTWEVVIAPVSGEAARFKPGQFVWLNVGHSPFSVRENPFSIASAAASRDHLAFVIKEVGDFTRSVGAIAPGTRAYIDGPHGAVRIDRRKADGIALIAGGVGIAPLLSILRELRIAKDPRPIVLVYGNRQIDQIVRAEEIETAKLDLDLRVEHVLSEPPPGWVGRTGVVDGAMIRTLLSRPHAARWLYVICGPTPMIEGVEAALMDMGIPARQIIAEEFYFV